MDELTLRERIKRWILNQLGLVEQSRYVSLRKECVRLEKLVQEYHKQIPHKPPEWSKIPAGSDYEKVAQRLEKLAFRTGNTSPMAEDSPHMPEPDPAQLVERLLCLLTPRQLARFVRHCEAAAEDGWGRAWIDWENYRPDMIGHQSTDKISGTD